MDNDLGRYPYIGELAGYLWLFISEDFGIFLGDWDDPALFQYQQEGLYSLVAADEVVHWHKGALLST